MNILSLQNKLRINWLIYQMLGVPAHGLHRMAYVSSPSKSNTEREINKSYMCAKTKSKTTVAGKTSTETNRLKEIVTTEKALELLADVRDKYEYAKERRNIVNSERAVSIATGAFILYTGISNVFRSPFSSMLGVLAGSALLLRGATGYCPIKEQLTGVRDITVVVDPKTEK